ncbi:Mu transposase C-terminal domain-containing protein [Nonomuraea sp. NPDC049158]|uniref:Mu transposase C-terminal domain-containing protein n=1 Tax=Nonomuraea sp. NPDC049158 TaxID=3155649 RepID=UPI00340CC530
MNRTTPVDQSAKDASAVKADELRASAVRHLLALQDQGRLTSEQVRTVACCFGRCERTVYNWLKKANAAKRKQRPRFEATEAIRVKYAFWQGNVSAVHRELVEEANAGGPPAFSLSTLRRAVMRDLSPGERAGLRDGERAQRAHFVYLQRPALHRNAAWEGDHVEASVEVELDGRLLKPWVTWFIDTKTKIITGLAVSADTPNRSSVLLALRSALSTDESHLPFGGLPERIRVDQGKDFGSKAVAVALGQLAVVLDPLPGYRAHLKGTVEALNGAVEKMFFAGLPRHTHRQRLINGKHYDPDQPPLPFTTFVGLLMEWVEGWNNKHVNDTLGTTPAQAWHDDPAPITEVSREELRLLTLEDDRKVRTITSKGIHRGKKRRYVAPWMTDEVGLIVKLRLLPHYEDEVEVFDARDDRYLGAAFLSDRSNADDRAEMYRARAKTTRRTNNTQQTAASVMKMRYRPVTSAEPPRRMTVLAAEETNKKGEEPNQDAMAALAIVEPPPRDEDLPAGWVSPLSGKRKAASA